MKCMGWFRGKAIMKKSLRNKARQKDRDREFRMAVTYCPSVCKYISCSLSPTVIATPLLEAGKTRKLTRSLMHYTEWS